MNEDPYRRISGIYDSVFASMNRGLQNIGLSLCPPYQGMKVLDVGCGTGQFLASYQKAGCEIHGLDPSPSMLELAKNRLGESAALRLGDAAAMPYDADAFDLVASSLVIHELDEPTRKAVIGEMKRVVKQDGRILIIDFQPGPIRSFKGWYRKTFITISEIAAGREHYRNFRDFIARQGMPRLAEDCALSIDQQKIVGAGTIGIFVMSTPGALASTAE